MKYLSPKSFITDALNCYAAFFANVADGNEDEAKRRLVQIREIDHQAAHKLKIEDFDYYKARRSALMKVFGQRLMHALEGQVEAELLLRAKDLAGKFEKGLA